MALKHLDATWTEENIEHQLCIKLEDAIEFPWACNNIQSLLLTIAIPDTPLHHSADGIMPYYHRPLPIALSTDETQQFRDLETLYRQLGALTELERLDLWTLFFDPSGDRLMSGNFMVNTFPGLFSLGKKEAGRPGYLQLLRCLTKLKELYGSTCLVMEETEVTVGIEGIEWMDRHWVALEKVQFGKRGQECLKVLDWWDEVQRSRMDL